MSGDRFPERLWLALPAAGAAGAMAGPSVGLPLHLWLRARNRRGRRRGAVDG